MTSIVKNLSTTEKFTSLILLAPFIAWGTLIIVFGVKKQFVPNIQNKLTLNVDTWLVGSRFLLADVAEKLAKQDDLKWTGEKSTITFDSNSNSLLFESSFFTKPALLRYDGFKWTGFTYKQGRGMPIVVEAWPDFK